MRWSWLPDRLGPIGRVDVFAGLTVAAYLVPQVMGYASVAGLPEVAGLWGLAAALTVYLLVGSSPQLSVGPESSTAVMTAAFVAPLAGGDPGRYVQLAAVLAILTAGVFVIAWVVRLGFLADLLSRPVLIGYMAGVAALMLVGQLERVTGVQVDGTSVTAQVRSFARHVDELHVPTMTVAMVVLAVLMAGRNRLRHVPIALLAVVGAAGVVALFSVDGVSLVGTLPRGVPSTHLGSTSVSDVRELIAPALGLATVAFSDNMLTARAVAARRGYEIDGNRELAALGAANLASGLVAGMPVSSSASRTAIADSMGSTRRASSVVAVTCVVVLLVIGRSALSRIPAAALGAVVVAAAISLVDVGGFRSLARFRRSEAVIAVVTMVAVLAFDILVGVLAAVALSVIDLVRRVARPHDGVLGFAPGVAGMHDVDDYPDARMVSGLLVYRYDAPLCFANADNFRRRALAATSRGLGPPEWFLLNAEANVDLDSTALAAIESLSEELSRRNVVFAMARVKQEVRDVLAATGFIERIGEDRVFMTLPTAVAAYGDWHERIHGTRPVGLDASSGGGHP